MAFRDVVGHRKLVALLARAVSQDSLPPSLILEGPSGVGKRLLAVATAQALNCSNVARRPSNAEHRTPNAESPVDACGTCAACKRIARGVHPDVFLLEPGDTGSIKIEAVRDAVDRAGYRPFEGR